MHFNPKETLNALARVGTDAFVRPSRARLGPASTNTTQGIVSEIGVNQDSFSNFQSQIAGSNRRPPSTAQEKYVCVGQEVPLNHGASDCSRRNEGLSQIRRTAEHPIS